MESSDDEESAVENLSSDVEEPGHDEEQTAIPEPERKPPAASAAAAAKPGPDTEAGPNKRRRLPVTPEQLSAAIKGKERCRVTTCCCA